MDELILPANAERLKKHLAALRNARRDRQAEGRKAPRSRKSPTPAQRLEVLAQNVHALPHLWWKNPPQYGLARADHVLSHSHGGAHSLCNNYRWDYSAEEFQWVLKIGVWARRQMGVEREVKVTARMV